MADDRYRYVDGEMERIALATQNSDLRSDLLAAHQEMEHLCADRDEWKEWALRAHDKIDRLRQQLDDARMHAEQDACEIERLRAAGDALAEALRANEGRGAAAAFMSHRALTAWQEARRG